MLNWTEMPDPCCIYSFCISSNAWSSYMYHWIKPIIALLLLINLLWYAFTMSDHWEDVCIVSLRSDYIKRIEDRCPSRWSRSSSTSSPVRDHLAWYLSLTELPRYQWSICYHTYISDPFLFINIDVDFIRLLTRFF